MKRLIVLTFFGCFIFAISQAQSIINPGFETGSLSPWAIWHPATSAGTAVVSTNAHSGTYAATISGGVCSIEQIVSGLKPWTKYTMSAWVKIASAGDSVTLGVKKYRAGLQTTVKIMNTGYAKYSISFVTGNIDTTATFYLVTSDSHAIATADD